MPYNGPISKSPVGSGLKDSGEETINRSIPDPNILSYAYRFDLAPIDIVRIQAKGWHVIVYTTLLGEDTERRLMSNHGYLVKRRNKWSALDRFAELIGISYIPTIVGLDGVEYPVDRQQGAWGTYDKDTDTWTAGHTTTRARELCLYVTIPPGLPSSNEDFIRYISRAMAWLMPYFATFVKVIIALQSRAKVFANPRSMTVGITTLRLTEMEEA